MVNCYKIKRTPETDAKITSKLYNTINEIDAGILAELPSINVTEHKEDFQEQEINAAIQNFKHGKAPGLDSITAEMIQAGGKPAVKVTHRLCNKVYKTSATA